MAFVSFVSVDKLGFGRLHAISLVLVFLAIASQPLGSFALLATYGLCLLLSLRLQHLSERLEQYGEGRGVPVVPAFLETLTWVILPWAAATALFAWLTPRMAERTRFLDFNWGQRVTSVEYFKPSSTNELLRDLLILAVLVAAMIFTVWWFERHLVFRRRSKSSGPSVNLTSATSTVIAMESGSVAPRREDLHDARGRILQRFRSLAGEFARMGFPRTRSETASEFIGRVQSTVGQEGMTPGESMSVFERACYSPLSVTDSEAEAFFAWATGAEKAVNERSKKQKPPANLPDAPA
jgi:hypothetical protein